VSDFYAGVFAALAERERDPGIKDVECAQQPFLSPGDAGDTAAFGGGDFWGVPAGICGGLRADEEGVIRAGEGAGGAIGLERGWGRGGGGGLRWGQVPR